MYMYNLMYIGKFMHMFVILFALDSGNFSALVFYYMQMDSTVAIGQNLSLCMLNVTHNVYNYVSFVRKKTCGLYDV